MLNLKKKKQAAAAAASGAAGEEEKTEGSATNAKAKMTPAEIRLRRDLQDIDIPPYVDLKTN